MLVGEVIPNLPQTNASLKLLVPEGNKGIDVPLRVMRWYGCYNCEWRGTGVCDYHIPRGRSVKVDKSIGRNVFEAICEKRSNFLRLIYPTDNGGKPMNLEELKRAYREWHMNSNFSNEVREMYELDDKITAMLETEPDNVALPGMIQRRDQFIERIHAIGRDLNRLHEMQKDRESREKSVKDMAGRLSLSEIHRIMRGDIVEDAVKVIDVKEDNVEVIEGKHDTA